jgi:hypothetical protein
MTDVAPLTVADILNIAVWSGAAGGVIAVGTQITVRQNNVFFAKEPAHPWPVTLMIATHIVMGMGSAVGLLFVLHFLQLLHPDQTVDNVLFLISGCLIAGIAAQRLIPTLTDTLTRQLKMIEKEAEQTREVAEEAFLLTQATATLDPNIPKTDKLKMLSKMRAQLSKTPLDRALIILSGRLYRGLGDLRGAVEVLETFVRNKESAGQIDKDVADALYNIACYYCLEWNKNKSAGTKTKSLDALRRSTQISPENKRDAIDDPDFDCLREEQEFKDIVQ